MARGVVDDEIGIYLDKHDICETQESGKEKAYTSLYDYLSEVIATIGPGAGGVIFTPWLHGNRCPFEDPDSAGVFFNVKLETGKTELIRAVVEGVCYHLRWMLECQDKKIRTSQAIRFCGGGALSDVISQMLADITGRTIEVVDRPQNVGSVGAAAVAGVGLGIIDKLEDVGGFIPAVKTFTPDVQAGALYEKNYQVFRQLYKANRKLFKTMND